MNRIFKKLKEKKIKFSHVCEAGVYTPEYSNIIDFIKAGIRTTLIEAVPEIVARLQKYFENDNNVTIYSKAIWDYTGKIKLSKASASTFVSELQSSPALTNDKYIVTNQNMFVTDCCVFSEIDDGSIDLLSIDIEGSEWYVLKHIVSKPKIISIETHGRNYSNPFKQNILDWAKNNNYSIWYKNLSDTVFVRKDVFKVTLTEKVLLKITELVLSIQKQKRKFFNRQ